MPKQALKIERFEGGLNNHFEERDIPDNSFVKADNVMFDKVGVARPVGYVENLSLELGLTDIEANSAPGYGLFSFSSDWSNPIKTSIDTLSDTTPTPSSAWQTSQTHYLAAQTSTSGIGSGAKFKIATDGSGNPTVTITNSGTGYKVDDTLVLTDPGSTSNTATITVASVTSKNLSLNSSVVDANVGNFQEEDGATALDIAGDSTNHEDSYFKLHDSDNTDNPHWKIENIDTGSGSTNGWTYDATNMNISIDTNADNTTKYFFAVLSLNSATGDDKNFKNKAYKITAYYDGNVSDTSVAIGNGNTDVVGNVYFWAHQGVSLLGEQTDKSFGKQITGHSEDINVGSGVSDIFTLSENSNGNIGFLAKGAEVRILKVVIQEVPSPKETSYILMQNNNYINLLDTSNSNFTKDILNLDINNSLENVKSQYYVADGVLRVYDSNFKNNTCENKWYGFVQRRHFLDTATVVEDGDGGNTNIKSTSGAFIWQWVEEDQKLYMPSTDSHTGDGDGKPGKYDFLDEEDNQVFTDGTESTEGIKLHIGTLSIDDATYDGSYKFYLSYLYDDSEQESKLKEIGSDTGADGKALFLGITVDYNNANGYAFNKRIVGARLYYSDSTDSEGFKYHLLDIDFEEGCRKFDDVEFTAWNVETSNSVVECPSSLIGSTPSDGSTAFFQFDQMPKVTTYEMINGYAPDETIYFRYQTAVIALDKLWVGNIAEVDDKNAIINKYGDRIISSPRGRFDIIPRENFLEISINDGDEIIKLESLADRLLVFKKNMFYIINIGKDGSEYIESEHRFLGISHPSCAIKTEGGVAWVNKRGCFVFDGKNLINLIKDKIRLDYWDSFIGKSGLIGFIPEKKQLFILQDPFVMHDTSMYIYDFGTKSWSKGVNNIGSNEKSNIINVYDTNNRFDGSPIFTSIKDGNDDENLTVSSYDEEGSGDAPLASIGTTITHSATTTLTINVDGTTLASTFKDKKLRFYVEDTNQSNIYSNVGDGNLTITDNALGAVANDGTELSGVILAGALLGKTKEEVAERIYQYIEGWQNTLSPRLFEATLSGDSIYIESVNNIINSTTNAHSHYNGHKLKYGVADASGTAWTENIITPTTISFAAPVFSGGTDFGQEVKHIGVENVNDIATTDIFELTIIPLAWVPLPDGQQSWSVDPLYNPIKISYTGGSDITILPGGSSGTDDTNQKVASDLRAVADSSGQLAETGITVSDGVYGASTTDQGTSSNVVDKNNDQVYFFALKGRTDIPQRFNVQANVYSVKKINKFSNKNVKNISKYSLITKDFDFGYPSVKKKIYKVYITFKSVDKDNDYTDSSIKVYYGTNSLDIFNEGKGTQFSTTKSKGYGTTGLSAFREDSSLNTTLSSAMTTVSSTDESKIASLTSSAGFKDGYGLKIDSEQMLISQFLSTDKLSGDGAFPDADNWKTNSGSALSDTSTGFTLTSNTAVSAADTTDILYHTTSSGTILNGRTYLIKFTLSSVTAGDGLSVSIGGGSTTDTSGGYPITTFKYAGTYYAYRVAGTDSRDTVRFASPSNNAVTIDDVTVQLMDRDRDAEGIDGNDVAVYIQYYASTASTHDSGATALVAPTDFVVSELKPSSGINNVYSAQFKLESTGGAPANFEVNDITIVYRAKNIK